MENDRGQASVAADAEVNRIIDSIPDPTGVLDDAFRADARALMNEIDSARIAMNFTPYDRIRRVILLHELGETKKDYHGKKRLDGTDVFDSHLMGAVRNLIHVQGRTGIVSLAGGIRHDSKEDLGKRREDLLRSEAYGIPLHELPLDFINEVRGAVWRIVEAVSKIRKDTPEETTAATFKKFLVTTLGAGLRAVNVKLGDRQNNMETLNGHPEPNRRRIARETEDIYVPFGEIIGVQLAVQRLVDACMAHLNPNLLNGFLAMRDARLREFVEPHREAIIADLEGLNGSIDSVTFKEDPLSKFALKGVPFNQLSLQDLKVSPIEPLCEVVVTTKPNVSVREVVAKLVGHFSDPGTHIEIVHGAPSLPGDRPTPQRGVVMNVHSPRYRRPLVFRVNNSVSEARLKRGIIGQMNDAEFRNYLNGPAQQVMALAERTKRDIVQVAKDILLRPDVVAYTPEHQAHRFPLGATVLDFAAKVHSHLLLGLQSAQASHHVFDRRFKPIGIFDPVQNDTVIELVSSLKPGDALEREKTSVDPGWLVFCETVRARTAIKRHLRGSPSPLLKAEVQNAGLAYLRKASALFGVSAPDLLNKVSIRKGETNDTRFEKIGTADVDLTALLARHFFENQETWKIDARLPDEPGVFRTFTEEFARQGINVGFSASEPLEEGMAKVRFTLEFLDARPPYEMLKILLKLSYKFDIAVVPEERIIDA